MAVQSKLLTAEEFARLPDDGMWIGRNPDTVRAPDVAFVAEGRLPPGPSPAQYPDLAPDLVVEVVSPSDRPSDVRRPRAISELTRTMQSGRAQPVDALTPTLSQREREQNAPTLSQKEREFSGVDTRLAPGLRNFWYPIFSARDLRREPIGVKRLGEDLVLWRDAHGQPHVFIDSCAHRGARLSLGRVHGDILQCWYHGWQYDAAGQCRLVPTEGDDFAGASRMRVQSYPVEDRGGLIWAYLGDVGRFPPPPLQVPEELESREWNGFILPVVWNINWILYLENLADPMHGPFLHARSYTLSRGARQDRMRVVETADGLIAERQNQRMVNFDAAEFHLPSWFRVDIPYPPSAGPGGPLHIVLAATPIDADSSVIYFVRMRRVTGWKWWLWKLTWRLYLGRAAWNVIEQDRMILESQRGLESRLGEHLVGSDRGVVHLRALLSRELARQDAILSRGPNVEASAEGPPAKTPGALGDGHAIARATPHPNPPPHPPSSFGGGGRE